MGAEAWVGIAVLAAASGQPAAVSGHRAELVREGVPGATIVLAVRPSRAAFWAAHDLQYHIELITGAKVPIRREDEPVEGFRILVGESQATRQLGLKAADLNPQEYLIRFVPGAVVLLGLDAPAGPSVEAPGVKAFGQPTWVDGRSGKALAFDGQSALDVEHFTFSDAEGAMEAWVWMPAEPSASPGTILRLDGRDPWSYHIIQRRAKTPSIEYVTYVESPKSGACLVSKPLAEGWHHVRGTYSAKTGQIELWVDGASQGKAPYAETTCAGQVLRIGGIGRAGGPAANGLIGRIDDVRLSGADGRVWLALGFDEGTGVPGAQGIVPPPRPTPPPMFEEQATCYAVYDFLERFCHVRWFNPTDFGTDCPKTATLRIEGRDVRRRPFFCFRQVHPAGARYDSHTGLWYPESEGYRRYEAAAYARLHAEHPGQSQYATAKQERIQAFLCRHRVGGQSSAVNHSFYGYYDRFWEKNPGNPQVFVEQKVDWFSRDRAYGGRPAQLCYTSPGLIEQVAQDARDFFDGKPVPLLPGFLAPGSHYFPLEPMDNSRYCRCERCLAWYKEPEHYLGFSNGTHSDYIFHFVNEVAKAVRRTHPDKQVAVLAYHSHAAVPKRVKLEPNVVVHFCFACNRLFYDRFEYEHELKFLKEWATQEKGRPLYLWLYYTFPTEIAWGSKGVWDAFPGWFAHTLDKQFKLFHQYGIRGMFHCGYGQEVEAYVTFKLMDDPTLDVEGLLDEYFQRLYGVAAEPLRQFYLLVEEAYGNPANYPPRPANSPMHQTEEIAWGRLGTPQRLARLGELMAQAKGLARTDLERARVDLFEKAVWDYLKEGRRKYEARHPLREQRGGSAP